jgi:hypothetical protein
MEHIPTPYINDRPYNVRPGDRIIYDSRNGTLFLYTVDGSDVRFRSDGQLLARCFVGRDWSRDHTRAFAELVVRTSGTEGAVEEVEGSFPTLWAFAVKPKA